MSDSNLFWNNKLHEQDEAKSNEIHQLMDSLRNFQEGYAKIRMLKRHFVSGKQYHPVLRTWEKDLDAIFDLAERYLK